MKVQYTVYSIYWQRVHTRIYGGLGHALALRIHLLKTIKFDKPRQQRIDQHPKLFATENGEGGRDHRVRAVASSQHKGLAGQSSKQWNPARWVVAGTAVAQPVCTPTAGRFASNTETDLRPSIPEIPEGRRPNIGPADRS
jgi:hypothetical protein